MGKFYKRLIFISFFTYTMLNVQPKIYINYQKSFERSCISSLIQPGFNCRGLAWLSSIHPTIFFMQNLKSTATWSLTALLVSISSPTEVEVKFEHLYCFILVVFLVLLAISYSSFCGMSFLFVCWNNQKYFAWATYNGQRSFRCIFDMRLSNGNVRYLELFLCKVNFTEEYFYWFNMLVFSINGTYSKYVHVIW